MLSISSIFSAITGSVGALRKAPENSAPGSNIAKSAEAVDDVVSLSSQGIQAASRAQTEISGRPAAQKTVSPSARADEDQQLKQLQQTDRAVRAHEQAHIAAGGGLVRGSASFTYKTGPDGKQYVVGGEVSIDTSPGRTPQESIEKARTIRASALAPADPSPQDRAIAAQATRIEAEARQQIAAQHDEPATDKIASPQQLNSHAAALPSPQVTRGITAYQENRDIFSLVAQTSFFRTSA